MGILLPRASRRSTIRRLEKSYLSSKQFWSFVAILMQQRLFSDSRTDHGVTNVLWNPPIIDDNAIAIGPFEVSCVGNMAI